MEIAIAGGTGMVGRSVAQALRERGHAVRLLSRRPPGELPAGTTHRVVDLAAVPAAGLRSALEGVDVVVDAANARRPRQARAVLVHGGRRLAETAAEAGVRHHVLVSIVGVEHLPFGYYKAKAAQERALAGAPLPVTTVRTTPYHELVAAVFAAAARARVLPAGRLPLQPLAGRDAAAAIAEVVEGGPGTAVVEAGGPEVVTLARLAQAYRRARGARAVPVPVPLAGRTAGALADGALLTPAPDHRGTVTFDQWLAA